MFSCSLFRNKTEELIIPVVYVRDLAPRTEPSVIPAIIEIINKMIGIKNLFLRYQRLCDIM